MIYSDTQLSHNKKRRVFNESVNSEELKWHKDEYDRIIFVESSDGWKIQMDEELPQDLKVGQKYIINKDIINSSNIYMQNTHYNILMDYNDMQLSSSNTSDFCVIKRNELNIQKRNGGIVYQSIINASNLDIYNISASLVNVACSQEFKVFGNLVAL